MTELVVLIVILYAFGVLATALLHAGYWKIERDIQQEYAEMTPREASKYGPNFVQDQHDKYQRNAQQEARKFVRAPLWPLMALAALGRIITDAKEPNQ